MANRCVSLDATWAHLPAPHPTWLSPDDALTAALWASMAPSACAASSYSSASPTPSSSTTTTTSSASAEILAAASARRAAGGGGATTRPTGRVSKRKPRPSRRAHTTYISADPANFRRMVQEITGLPIPGAADTAYASVRSSPAPQPAELACVLPTLDTSAFLLDRASPPPPPPPPQPERKSNTSAAAVLPATTMASTSAAVAAASEEASSSSPLLRELKAMTSASAFPTLESWGVI